MIDEKTHRVAGCLVNRDLLAFPPGFLETYRDEASPLTPWCQFLWDLDAKATKRIPLLQQQQQRPDQKNVFVDLWMLGVHPDYRGLKLANHLVRASEIALREAGCRFATIEAVSAFTTAAALRNAFVPVAQIEAKDWLWQGKPFYTNIEKPHGTWTFFLKDVQGGRTEEAIAD